MSTPDMTLKGEAGIVPVEQRNAGYKKLGWEPGTMGLQDGSRRNNEKQEMASMIALAIREALTPEAPRRGRPPKNEVIENG